MSPLRLVEIVLHIQITQKTTATHHLLYYTTATFLFAKVTVQQPHAYVSYCILLQVSQRISYKN